MLVSIYCCYYNKINIFSFCSISNHISKLYLYLCSSLLNKMNNQFIYSLHSFNRIGLQQNRSLIMQQRGTQQPDLQQFLHDAPQTLTETLQQNLQNRLKFPTETQKFYSTQQQIHNILTVLQQKLEQTQQGPDKLITKIIESKILVPLLQTLEHPNLDINISAVNCLYALIVDLSADIQQAEVANKEQDEEGEEAGEAARAFAVFFRMVVWMVENGVVQSLFKIASRLEEEKVQQYECTRKILKIFQNLIELTTQSHQPMLRYTTIVSFLANRILPNFKVSHRILDDNKFIASDVLLSLLQTPQLQQQLSAAQQFYKCFGIQILVQTISSYENKLPASLDQKQYLINLFDCLNLMLVTVKPTKAQFWNMKGCYLMISYVCVKSQYAVPALKAVSNCLDFEDDHHRLAEVCDQIVNDGSLKYLFPILMMQGIKGKDDEQQGQINEHILKILYFLLKNSQGVSRDRIIYKFTQKRFAKLQRVFELLVQCQGQLNSQKSNQISAKQYLRLVKDQNLSSAQTCSKIIATFWDCSSEPTNKKIKQRISALMGLYSIKATTLRLILQLHYRYIDEGKQKEYIAKLLANQVRQIEDTCPQ